MNEINKNNLLKVGIYLRISNDEKDNKLDENESIKNQRNLLIDYINKNPSFYLVNEYCDEDLSGAGTYRPEFERLIEDCKNKKLDIVLCKSQSRFSRDMEIVEKYINNKFKEWNIRFIGLADNADTLVKGNKKARQINGLVNEWYLEDVSNNIRSAFISKMKQGEFISPFAPFGYEISKENKNKLIIDPIASEIIKRIFNLYLEGFGFCSIAKILNNENIPSPSLYKYQKGIKLNIVSNKNRSEIKWSSNAIKTILTNEIYIGNLLQGKRTTISYKNHKIISKNKSEWIKSYNTHEAIIDKDTFKKVNLIIKQRTKTKTPNNHVHIFSGKVFCLNCNHYMRKKNSSKHEYLVCTNDNCENKKSIRYDILSDIVLNEINNYIYKYYDINTCKSIYLDKYKKLINNSITYLNNQSKLLKNNIVKNEIYIQNLYEDKVNSIITLEQFTNLIKKYDNDNNYLKKQLKKINDKINNYSIRFLNINNKLFIKYKKINKLNNIILDEFIDKIFIGKEKNNERIINIIWNF